MSSHAEFGHGEGALKRVAERVIEAKAEFERHAKTLDSQLASMPSKWVGQGGSAFTNLQIAWQEKHRTVVGALDNFHSSLIATESDNINTDQANSADIAHLQGRLDA